MLPYTRGVSDSDNFGAKMKKNFQFESLSNIILYDKIQ